MFKLKKKKIKSPFLGWVLYVQFSSSASTCCPQTESSPSLRNSLFVCLDKEEKFIQLAAREREPEFDLSLKEPEELSFFIFFHIKIHYRQRTARQTKRSFFVFVFFNLIQVL